MSFHWALKVKKLASNLHTRRAGVTGRSLHNHHHTDARTTKDFMVAWLQDFFLASWLLNVPLVHSFSSSTQSGHMPPNF